jgi:NADH dehydrogenase (ubiquinone) 1 alpha subcomplex subunit 9
LILPYRGDHYDMLRLRLVGDLGQVLFMPYELRDEASIKKAMRHSNVVINLIGRDWETKNFKFEDIYVDGPARIARIQLER